MVKITSKNVLACFSPPVMVATFLLEACMAVYTLVRYKMSQASRLILGLLINLALFQAAEYFVCTHSAIAVFSARFGFAAITVLPPLAFYLMSELTHPLPKKVAIPMFAITAGIVTYFLLASSAFNSYQCTGNYVIFQINQVFSLFYGFFYFGLIAISMWQGARYISTKHANKNKNYHAVQWLLAGYIVFLAPVAVLIVLHPDTRQAVPSLLCGFAVSMAIILTAKVAPLTLKKRK